MSVQILIGEDGQSCLYCSVTDWAFGPVFHDDESPEEFLEWLKRDPRGLTDKELESKYVEWQKLKEMKFQELPDAD